MDTILEAKQIIKEFKVKKERLLDKKSYFRAVNDISLRIRKGQTIGIVGESGSGKSTVSEIIGDLQKPTSGTINYEGKDIRKLSQAEYRDFRKNVQFIFQSPKDSLHPFYTIKENLLEPLKIYAEEFNQKQAMIEIENMIKKVNLDVSILKKHASEISGGQAQRVAIARALLLKPKVIICDECVSALDVSVQAQILDLLLDLQEEFATSYLFISHDISAVNYVSDYVVVMKNGEVLEEGVTDQVLFQPQSDYTKTLISSSFLSEEDEVHAL
ncbi:ABC transporter ATP-binding protein [Oceanobacillus damuensis]|uniref:ABC transporter ATP-binding protein n=1 Tax=Oceanobacillus damuensis TaxID=937928 RepID=UPI00082E46AB|nr:ATP-binding cassette domain-containing protein [Oceanobacillus damuensis]